MSTDNLRQTLAAIEHERWASWQRWMHDQGYRGSDGSLRLPADLVERWENQIATPYGQLTQREQASDMEQVDRYWPHIQELLDRLDAAEARVAAEAQLAGERAVWIETMDTHAYEKRKLIERAEAAEARIAALEAAGGGLFAVAMHDPMCPICDPDWPGNTPPECGCEYGPAAAAWRALVDGGEA